MSNEIQKRVFVRYGNRKLHEVGARKSYVTMTYLLEVVSAGENIQVVEDTTGDDITAYTFSRLIFDRCRRNKDAFPVKLLQDLLMKAPLPQKSPQKKRKKASGSISAHEA